MTMSELDPLHFLTLVRKSGVLDEQRLNDYLAQTVVPTDPNRLAEQMVRDSLLTAFQAEKLLLGRWRGFTIGKYKVLERLGSGGMGNVYLCEHKFMHHRVAVKVLANVNAADPALVERFYREARAAALEHPNIVHAHDVDQDNDLHFLVMDYVDGSNLQSVVQQRGPLEVRRAANYVWQAALGMQHAHEAGLVHRDIKPSNLLVDRSGTVKVADLGLARFATEEGQVLTEGVMLGSVDYLAPEQALDSHGVDIRADVYGLGATFYFLLTGVPPFAEAKNAPRKLIAKQTQAPRPVRTLRPAVPHDLAAVVEKMMARDPADRYATPAEVAAALEPWTGGSILPPPESEMPRLSPAARGTSAGTGHALTLPSVATPTPLPTQK